MKIRSSLATTLIITVAILTIAFFTIRNVTAQHNTTADTSGGFDQVFIFGDSQSDIGNGPESLTMYGDSDSSDNIFFNLYVPISNPIEGCLASNNKNVIYQPALNLCKGSDNSSDNGDTCTSRKHCSYNWVQYFIDQGIDNGNGNGVLSPDIQMEPWVRYYKDQQSGQNQNEQPSVNYAWYSAITTNQCTDVESNPQNQGTECSGTDRSTLEQNIYDEQNTYRTSQSEDDADSNYTLREQLIIPGAQKQLDMFFHDFPNPPNPNTTLYIVWTGANDLANALGDNLLKNLVRTIPNEIAGVNSDPSSPSIVTRLINHEAKNILVVGQYNLGLTPGMHFIPGNASMLGKLTQQFNNAVSNLVNQQEDQHSDCNIQFVDIEAPIKEAEGTYYKRSTLGTRCENVSENRQLLEQGAAVSCMNPQQVGWWNTSHLANGLNQVIATSILDQAADNNT